MRKRIPARIVTFTLIITAFVFVAVPSYPKKTVHLALMTGGLTGTYYQFGLNLKSLAAQHGVVLDVHTSNGSVENIYAVFKRPHTQMGIVQSDVLAFVAKVQTDPVLKKIAEKIMMVYPLYNEEVHLIGRKSLQGFDDLKGKRVAIGQEGSGTYLTAKLLFEVSGVEPAEELEISADDALPQLKAGEIDAMFYVAGYPVKLFSEQVETSDQLALLPIQNPAITEFYPTADVPAGTYAWQAETVHSVAVKSVLVTYDFQGENCQYVGEFARVVSDNLSWLRANGHPKWQSVDLEYPLKGWSQYGCVKKYQAKPAREVINPVLQAIKNVL
ncbi:MAG: TAXI family TRAP transporter solute-binding subunit [Desulfopila sp.]